MVNSAVTYTNGEVATAFQYNGSNSSITMPANTSLAVSNLTLETWIFPTDLDTLRPIFDYGGAGQYSSISLWLNTQDGLSVNPGGLHALVRGQAPLSSPFLDVGTVNTPVTLNQWNHVVFTDNLTTRVGVLYWNGAAVVTNTATGSGPVVPIFPEPMNLGYRNSASLEALAGSCFKGNIDEASIYSRPLSASEIKAIYHLGTNGKYDPIVFNTSPAQSLAEVQVSLAGQTPVTIYGSNTVWQTYSNTFTATTNHTLLCIAGLQPGMLLDEFVLTTNVVNSMVTYTNGEVAQAFSFGGTNYVSIPDSPSLDGFTNRITLEAWVKVNSFAGAGWDCILAKGNSSWELRRYSNLSTAAFTLCGLNTANDLGGNKNINDGQWHHVAGVYDGTTKYLYVDGVLDASAPAAGAIAQNSYPAYIGGNAETQGKLPGYFWNGLIDEASIYNRSLSASEIKSIYQIGTNGKFDPITFNTSPAKSLAEARFSLTGQPTATLNGSNTIWQTYTATFKAVTNQTQLTVAGVEPGVLMGPPAGIQPGAGHQCGYKQLLPGLHREHEPDDDAHQVRPAAVCASHYDADQCIYGQFRDLRGRS